MTVIARRVAAIPVRTATATWEVIVDLMAAENAAAKAELLSVSGIAACLITAEALQDSPMIATGDGPRLRIYGVYNEKAIEGVGVDEKRLAASPLNGETWAVSLPCPSDDLTWVQAALKRTSTRITARDASITTLPEASDETQRAASAPTIDLEAFLRP
jgi:hypothetical protein